MHKLLLIDQAPLKKNSGINSHSTDRVDQEILDIFSTFVSSINLHKPNEPKIILSTPMIKRSLHRTQIDMFYFEGPKSKFSSHILNSRLLDLTSQLHKNDIVLNLVRIHYPYMNASIFAQYLFYNSSAKTFLHFQNSIQKYISWHGKDLLSHIKGIKVEISGRIITEKVIPRVTRKSTVFGSVSNADFCDYAKYTGKNYIGSITIKVWISMVYNSKTLFKRKSISLKSDSFEKSRYQKESNFPWPY